MPASHEQSIEIIHELIETCRDGSSGYRTATKEAKQRDLQTLFLNYAGERDAFVAQLRARARALGDDGKEAGSTAGALHRGWINLRAAVATNEPHAVLAECERGEDAAVAAYRKALESDDLDPETRELVAAQFDAVLRAHDRIKELRDSPQYRQKD